VRLGATVLCLPVGGLDALAGAVVAATADLGQPPEDRPFRGHLTVARARRGGLRGLPRLALAARWPVTELTLVASTLGREGARYEVLERFELTR
jgi:2'-5' RNA ligase